MAPPNRLLRACLRYFLKFGVANLSLRPLAAATGTSARMLLHHFGSKEKLIATVMAQVNARLQMTFATLAEQTSENAPAEVMRGFWRELTSKAMLPYLRLLLEVQVLALQNPARYQRYLAQTSSNWLRLIESTLPAGKNRTALATLGTAVIDGLLLEFLSSRDRRRTSAALELFVTQLGSKSPNQNHQGDE